MLDHYVNKDLGWFKRQNRDRKARTQLFPIRDLVAEFVMQRTMVIMEPILAGADAPKVAKPTTKWRPLSWGGLRLVVWAWLLPHFQWH